MVKAACHCGAVRLTVEPAPKWVLDCNCSICRRYGAVWAYTHDQAGKPVLQTTLVQGADALEPYIWGDRWSAVWRCKACGCVMVGTSIDKPEIPLSLNARMFVDFDPASVTLHRIDNAHTGRFWTRPDAEIRKGGHPPMPPPGPDDWR
jgi:hypothetical protein